MPETHIVSYSELDAARQCLLKHEKSYKQRWSRPARPGGALARGTKWHQLLEGHYRILKAAQDPNWGGDVGQELALNADNVLGPADQREPGSDSELIAWMYTGYLEHYGLDPEWKIMAVEFAPEVWLPTPRGGRSNYKLKLKIDLVVKIMGRLWIVDHKSGKDLPKSKELDVDDQFGLYTWAMRQLGYNIFGSIHSAARTQRNKDQERHPQALPDRFARSPMARTDIELDTIAVEAYRTLRNAYQFKIGEAPRSPDPDRCNWRCDYLESCLLGRKGIDMDGVLTDTGFVQDFTRH